MKSYFSQICCPAVFVTQIAGKLERALVEHKREISDQQREAMELRQQVWEKKPDGGSRSRIV